MQLSQLWRYPVKSLRGARFDTLEVTARGLAYDREWMVVDANGRFMTQRQHPRMTLIDTRQEGDDLWLTCPGHTALRVEMQPNASTQVRIWADHCSALVASDRINRVLSDFLGAPCRLVRQDPEQPRPIQDTGAQARDEVSFADAYPFLLLSEASMQGLNARLAQPLSIERFRPNLVISGCTAHAEDQWRQIRIGDILFDVAKACTRCTLPNVDPDTGTTGSEPGQTLRHYRRFRQGVLFGQNLIARGTGMLHVGDRVHIVSSVDD